MVKWKVNGKRPRTSSFAEDVGRKKANSEMGSRGKPSQLTQIEKLKRSPK